MVSAVDEEIHLADEERDNLVRIIESSFRVKKRHHFFNWTQGALQSLLPHEILICGLRDEKAGAHMYRFSSCRYFKQEHFEAVCEPEQGLISLLMKKWVKTGRPCMVGNEVPFKDNESCVSQLYKYELCNIAAHGVRGPGGTLKAFFSFSRVKGLGPRIAYMLELLVPYLHVTLTRVLMEEGFTNTDSVPASQLLTRRESEILSWLMQGKTNVEIATVLGLSPLTVKNHVQKILKKLQVQTRGHAVARAISLGIIRSIKLDS